MGTWYRIMNVDKREYIDPGLHGRWGIKYHNMHAAGHPASVLLIHALLGDWHGDRVAIVSDGDDSGYPGTYFDREAKDVTLDMLYTARDVLPKEGERFEPWSDRAKRIILGVKNSD